MAVACRGCSKGGSSSSPTQPSPTPLRRRRSSTRPSAPATPWGWAAARPACHSSPCPNGTGYVPVLARRLAETRQVQTTNLGIPAAVLSPEIQQLGPAVRAHHPGELHPGRDAVRAPRLDARDHLRGRQRCQHHRHGGRGGAGGNDPVGFIDQQVRGFGQSFDVLLRGDPRPRPRRADRRRQPAEPGGPAVCSGPVARHGGRGCSGSRSASRAT